MLLPTNIPINSKPMGNEELQGQGEGLSKGGKKSNLLGSNTTRPEFLNILQGLSNTKKTSNKNFNGSIENPKVGDLGLGSKEILDSLETGDPINKESLLNQKIVLDHDGSSMGKRDSTFLNTGQEIDHKFIPNQSKFSKLQKIKNTFGKAEGNDEIKKNKNTLTERKSFFVSNKNVDGQPPKDLKLSQLNLNSINLKNHSSKPQIGINGQKQDKSLGVKRNPFFVNKKAQSSHNSINLDTDLEREMILSNKLNKNLGTQNVAKLYSSSNEQTPTQFEPQETSVLKSSSLESSPLEKIMKESKPGIKENGKLIDILTKKEISNTEGLLPIQNNFKVGEKVQTTNSVQTSTFNMNNSGVNREGIINQISDYVSQMNLQNKDSLSLNVRHDTLGIFTIEAHKSNKNGNIDIQILTNSDEGNQFFKVNEGEMLKSMNQNGLKVVDVKVFSTSADSQLSLNKEGSDSSNEQGFSKEGSPGQRHGRNQDERDSSRRKELWEEYKERLGA